MSRDLLISCILALHISFFASQPIEELRRSMMNIGVSLCNLRRAEKEYVVVMFNGDPPNYKSNTSEPLKGITFPVRNDTREILDSICVINGYLEELPKIIRNLTGKPKKIIRDVTMFGRQFKRAASDGSSGLKKAGDLNGCHTNESTDDYSMKVLGIQIIHFSELWVKNFTGVNPAC